MELRTLGALQLVGSAFKRKLPLLLLAYLAVEGGKRRDHLADLLWLKPGKSSDKKQRLNNLSRTLSDLRQLVPDSFGADEVHVWANVTTDLANLETAVKEQNHLYVVTLYRGVFLLGQPERSSELGEWISEKRLEVALQVSQAHLSLAEANAGAGRFKTAADQAQLAYTLEELPLPEPEMLSRFYTLLTAGKNALAEQVKAEAKTLGVVLQLSPEAAQTRLRSVLLGREEEQEKLRALEPGSWAWLQGGVGIGKTSLLKSLSGTFLPARSGLPLATLAPLTELTSDSTYNLYKLRQLHGTWLIDDWERVDAESQALLQKLRNLKPELSVVVTAQTFPPFAVELHLELKLLTTEALCSYVDVWQKTEGVPVLVGAQLRGEPLGTALRSYFAALPRAAGRLYLSLALLEQPDLSVVRRALGLDAETVAACLEKLLGAGLVETTGHVRAREAALHYLDAHPFYKAELMLKLARQLPPLAAYSLYRNAKTLWTDADIPKVRSAYLAWAGELLRRGFPQQAVTSLAEAPPDRKILFLQAKALERAGRYSDALDVLEGLIKEPGGAETPEITGLKGKLYWRLGFTQAAQRTCQAALTGDLEVRAEALSTLGNLSRSAGRYGEAEHYDSRAEALWHAFGNSERWGGALNNLALSEAFFGKRQASTTLKQALEVVGNHPQLRSRILLNLGWLAERRAELKKAELIYLEVITVAETTGVETNAGLALNNLGALYYRAGRTEDAEQAYEKALTRANRSGDFRALGMALANLAELRETYDAWLEALALLEDKGHKDMATSCREGLPTNHPFKQVRTSNELQI